MVEGRRSTRAAGMPAGEQDRRRFARALVGIAVLGVGATRPLRAGGGAPVLAHSVVAGYPHDTQAFTQGLLFHAGELFESTGLRGRSTLRRVELQTGRVLAQRRLPDGMFGEGLARVGEDLLQITWQAGVAFRWRLADFEPTGKHHYRGEGWGIASDGERLWMSDGSDTLVMRDPRSFAVLGRLQVHDEGRPVPFLNELEFADGALYANVWQSSRIARIDISSGQVSGWIDLAGLPGPMHASAAVDVLNGIAWDADGRRLFVTGKLWPRLFSLEVDGLNRSA